MVLEKRRFDSFFFDFLIFLIFRRRGEVCWTTRFHPRDWALVDGKQLLCDDCGC